MWIRIHHNECGCRSGTNSTPKLILQVFNGVEVKIAGRPSQSLEVVSDNPSHSVGVSIFMFEDQVCSQAVEI